MFDGFLWYVWYVIRVYMWSALSLAWVSNRWIQFILSGTNTVNSELWLLHYFFLGEVDDGDVTAVSESLYQAASRDRNSQLPRRCNLGSQLTLVLPISSWETSQDLDSLENLPGTALWLVQPGRYGRLDPIWRVRQHPERGVTTSRRWATPVYFDQSLGMPNTTMVFFFFFWGW